MSQQYTFTRTDNNDNDDDIILETASSTPPHKRYSIGSTPMIPSLLNAKLHNLQLFNNNSKETITCIEHDLSKTSSALMSNTQLGKIISSIRSIEKNLNHLTIKANVKNIMILTKIYDDEINQWSKIISIFLLNFNTDINIFIQDELKVQYKELTQQFPDRIHSWFGDKCTYRPEIFDLILTFGGDGTVLFASWIFQSVIPPILAFSLGSLGFLTDFNVEDYKEILTNIITNGFQCSIRMRFECTIMKSINKGEGDLTTQIQNLNTRSPPTHEISETYCVFNEVVVDRGPNSTISSLEIFGGKEAITTAEADGLIISTPSGSTAYSLSAGGSLVHPEIPGILISPICPHTLSFRPLVIPESIILRIGVPYDARSTAWCSFDGKNRVELNKGDFLTVTPSRFPIPCIKKSNSKNAWFERISETLHWNERKKQKPLDI